MEKFLGDAGLSRLRDNLGGILLPQDGGQRVTAPVLSAGMLKCPAWDGTPYKMSELFPEKYDVMGSVPERDYASLPIADGLFKGCAGLPSLSVTLGTGVSASEICMDCAGLADASGMVLPASDLDRAFLGCGKLAKPPAIDWPRVASAYFAFCGCKSLPEVFPQVIDLSGMDDERGWRGMFADSSVRKVYVAGYDVSYKKLDIFSWIFASAWLYWKKGNGAESGGNITVSFTTSDDVPSPWNYDPPRHYTITASKELFENYRQYLRDNAARRLAQALCLNDRFYATADVDPDTASVLATEEENAVANATGIWYRYNDVEGAKPISTDYGTIVGYTEGEGEDAEPLPVYRKYVRTYTESNAYGTPWHDFGHGLNEYAGSEEYTYAYTFSVTHYTDRSLKLAVEFV